MSLEVQQIKIPGWTNLGPSVVAPNGDLWLQAFRVGALAPDQEKVLEISTAGKVIRVVDLAVWQMLVGPDGNIWFATTGPELRFGTITPHGRVRFFSALRFGALNNRGGALEGMTVATDDQVWFAVTTPEETEETGFISRSGAVADVPVSHLDLGAAPDPTQEAVDLNNVATDTEGTIWVAGLNDLWDIVPGNIFGTSDSVLKDALFYDGFTIAPDLSGHVWTASDMTAVVQERSVYGAVQRAVVWAPGSAGVLAGTAMIEAADRQMWIFGELCGDPCERTAVLEDISAPNGQQRYSLPSSLAGASPQLTAGPDGRLFTTIENAVDGEGNPVGTPGLWAIRLPNVTGVRPPEVDLTRTVASRHRTLIWLACSGQPGRYCYGRITVGHGSDQRTETYAVSPGYTETYTVTYPRPLSGIHVTIRVTNTSTGGQTVRTATVP